MSTTPVITIEESIRFKSTQSSPSATCNKNVTPATSSLVKHNATPAISSLVKHNLTPATVTSTPNTKQSDHSDFLEWKQEEESASDTAYIQQCAPKITSNATKVWYYYYCNRAGTYRPQGDGKRQSKQHVTNKIGNQCTAHLRVEVDLNLSKVYIKYCCTH